MDDAKQYKVIEDILLAAGITNRTDLILRFDRRRGIEGLKGIGRKRRKLIVAALNGRDKEWTAAFPLIAPYYAPTAPTLPVELSPVQGARVEWQPSEALLEGAGGMAVEGHSLSVPEGT